MKSMRATPASGRRVALFAAMFVLALPAGAGASTVTVTSNADDGAGTLRAAIAFANAMAGADTIAFEIGSGAATILQPRRSRRSPAR